jgi:hypothetical protein
VLDLLFTLCTWHALAKLRLHTSSTLRIFKATTEVLGQKLRYWVKKTCAAFDTRELPKEASARYRRKATAASKAGKSKVFPLRGKGGQKRQGKGQMPIPSSTRIATQQDESPDVHNSKNRKVFNMCTYKVHALGHYIAAIARFGTTDNYSTQIVNHILFPSLFLLIFFFQGELEHRRVKRFYARTNKRKNFGCQIAKQQRRERLLKRIREQWTDRREELQTNATPETLRSPAPNVSFEDSDPLPKTLPEVHHHISNTTRLKENIFRWVDFHEQAGDQAVKVI